MCPVSGYHVPVTLPDYGVNGVWGTVLEKVLRGIRQKVLGNLKGFEKPFVSFRFLSVSYGGEERSGPLCRKSPSI